MQDQHIASAFDRDLEAIQALIMKMGGLVETAILDSSKSLETNDIELAKKTREADRVIDRLEEQVNEETARVIALRAPTARDLRTVLTVLKISANLERCGDYAKNISKRTSVLTELVPIDGAGASIRRMAREVQLMLHDALDAYIQRDAELALQIIHRDEDIDHMYNALFRELLTHMMEDPRNITPSMHMHFIAKNIERMGDHVTSIAEQVVYLVTGSIPGDARPKGDKTSYVSMDKE